MNRATDIHAATGKPALMAHPADTAGEVKFMAYAGTMQESCLRFDGKFANPGLQSLDEDDDMIKRCFNTWCSGAAAGLQDPDLIAELGLGYAPGGNLRRHLADLGYRYSVSNFHARALEHQVA